MNEEGRYVCCGRTDDMFEVSRIWGSSFAIEQALIGYPSVLEATVVAARDADNPVKPKAYVALRRDGGVDLDEINEFVK